MKATLKTALAAGAAAAFIGGFGAEAKAEPVVSSWYGPGFEGRPTASGEVFSSGAHTAAHRSLPFGTQLLVTYGGRQAVVRVNDRGPHVGGRGLDLSRGAAEKIGLTAAGADTVDMQVLTGAEAQKNNARQPSSGYVGGYNAGYDSGKQERVSDERDYNKDAARLLEERPYMKLVGAKFTPYSRSSRNTCEEVSRVSRNAPHNEMSKDETKTRAVAAVARCSSDTRAS